MNLPPLGGQCQRRREHFHPEPSGVYNLAGGSGVAETDQPTDPVDHPVVTATVVEPAATPAVLDTLPVDALDAVLPPAPDGVATTPEDINALIDLAVARVQLQTAAQQLLAALDRLPER